MHLFPFASVIGSASSAALANALLASIWQGALLTTAAALGLQLLPGLSSAARSAIWSAVLLLLLAIPALALAWPVSRTPGHSALHAEETASLVIVAVWAAASLFRLVQLGASAVRLHRILHRAKPVAASDALQAIMRGAPRRVQLCVSPDVDRPSVAGFFRARILFPPELLRDLTEPELIQVVLHETEHLRRHDDWINLLQHVSLVLFPLNPALLWLNRRLSLERELACDESVLRATQARRAYAACLAHVAESTLLRRGAALALGILGPWARKPELTTRVERILRGPSTGLSAARTRWATGVLLTGASAFACVLAHSPQLVRFDPPQASIALAEPASSATVLNSSHRGLRPVLDRALLSGRGTLATGMASPHLVQARADMGPVESSTTRRERHAAHFSAAQKPSQAAGHPRTLLTNARQAAWLSRPSLHLTSVVFETTEGDTQVWYTAVAVRDGWLVVQL